MSSYGYLKIAVVLALFSLPLAVALSSASYFGVEAELSEPWSYDDWRFSDSVVDAEGSVELVEVDGRTAVHAVSLGDGSITLDNGRRISVDVGKADLDVYLIMGQSNAAYFRYEPDRASPMSAPGNCYFFGTNMPISLGNHANMVAGEYDTTFASYGMHDMVNPDGTARIGNWDAPLAALLHESTGKKVYMINAAVSGTPIRYFVPGEDQYVYAQDVFREAMGRIDTDLYEPSVKVYFWIQGGTESSSITQESYIRDFTSMHDTMIASGDGMFSDEWSFEACLMSQERKAVAAVEASAQEILAETVPTVHMATTIAQTFTIENGLLLPDTRHYTQLGDNIIAEAFANYYLGDFNERIS